MDQLLILSYWNPTDVHPNKGIFIHDQVRAICKNRSAVIFLQINILPSRGKFFEKDVQVQPLLSGTTVVITIYTRMWKLLYMLPGLIYQWSRRILTDHFKDFRPSIVHSNVIFPCALLGYRFARHFKAHHVITEHWSKSNAFLKHPIFGRRARMVYHQSDAIICVSQFLASKIKDVTGNPSVFRIPNIIDTTIFNYHGLTTRPPGTCRFLCVATWIPPKRLDLIVESLRKYAEAAESQLILNIVGEGKQKDRVATMTFPDTLTINFHGYISKEAMMKLYTETDVFMHASTTETFSIVTAEALATGTPVMVSNVDALPELVSADDGLLVENDVTAWVEAIKIMVNTPFNRAAISARVAQKYSPEAVSGMIEAVYATVMLKK